MAFNDHNRNEKFTYHTERYRVFTSPIQSIYLVVVMSLGESYIVYEELVALNEDYKTITMVIRAYYDLNKLANEFSNCLDFVHSVFNIGVFTFSEHTNSNDG